MAFHRQLLKKALGKAEPKIGDFFARLSPSGSFSTVQSATAGVEAAAPSLPPFDYQPRPYNGPRADQVFEKRKKFLGPSLFHFYQKPVCLFFSAPFALDLVSLSFFPDLGEIIEVKMLKHWEEIFQSE